MTMPPTFGPQITIPQWLDLPAPVRAKFVSLFSIPKSHGTEMFGNKIISDGYSHKDLGEISIPKMQKFLNSKSVDFYELLNQTTQTIFSLCEEEAKGDVKARLAEERRMSKERLQNLQQIASELAKLSADAHAADAALEEADADQNDTGD